jgi:glycosyltransferase involved in cell wall biosynthesis
VTNEKKNIVLLTTWYPPLQSIAVNRMVAFAKYLDHSRFKVTVVTIGDKNISGLSQEDYATVYRIKPSGSLWNPKFKSSDSKIWHYAKVAWKKVGIKMRGDELSFYVKEASKFLEDWHKKNKIDLLISSFSPAAPHLVGLAFCKKHAVKWIVDMRDEMSLNPQSDATVRKYYAAIEHEINEYASALTSVSQPIVDYFKTVIPDLRKYVEIRNGFDHELTRIDYNFNETFTLLHAGSFYGTRKPDSLLKALVNLDNQKKLPEKWKFLCAGAVKNFSIPDALKSHVEILERVSHSDSLSLMTSADLTVLIQPPTGRKGVYTGKVFEYLAAQKPILAIVDTTDVAADLIREMDAGYVADFSDVTAIENAILVAVENWQKKLPLQTNPERINTLHRKYQVQKLNLLIENLLDET